MANFMSLPKAVREKIYRLHLVGETQYLTLQDYLTFCGDTKDYRDWYGNYKYRAKKVRRVMPPLFHVGRKVEQEASPIYFGENTFALSGPEDLGNWKLASFPRHIRHVSKVVLLRWCELSTPWMANKAFMQLDKLPKLKSLTIMIDEEAELRDLLMYDPIIRCGGRSAMGPQISLQLYRLPGAQGFRSLRNVRELNFIAPESDLNSDDASITGLISGGFLDSARREILQLRCPPANKHKSRKSCFRFLDLPPEIRNIVYGILLLFPGSTYPIATAPVSATSQHKYKSHGKRAALSAAAPGSALNILLVSREIHNEAYAFFYQNDLVFPGPTRFQHFMLSLGNRRIECLRSLALFNEYGQLIDNFHNPYRSFRKSPPYIAPPLPNQKALEGIDKMDSAMLVIRCLPNLQKLHFLYRSSTMTNDRGWQMTSPVQNEQDLRYSDTYFMFETRNLSDIKVRDLDLEILAETGTYVQMHDVRSRKSALKHLNYGLKLAQTGEVVRELFSSPDWREEGTWPVLQGSECGFSKGCTCGPDED